MFVVSPAEEIPGLRSNTLWQGVPQGCIRTAVQRTRRGGYPSPLDSSPSNVQLNTVNNAVSIWVPLSLGGLCTLHFALPSPPSPALDSSPPFLQDQYCCSTMQQMLNTRGAQIASLQNFCSPFFLG